MILLTYSAISHILFEKPHSLSYQAEILPILLPTTLVSDESMMADALLWLKSTETSFSSVTFRIFLSFVLEAKNKELFNFFKVIFFFTLNINSIN